MGYCHQNQIPVNAVLAGIMALAVAVPAFAGVPSDSLILYAPDGSISAAAYQPEDQSEQSSQVIFLPGVALNTAEFGDATTLQEPGVSTGRGFSDIVGISAGGPDGLDLAFASDNEAMLVNFGAFPRNVIEHGPLNVSYLLDSGLANQGYTLVFTSDAVPEPAAWTFMLTGFGGLGLAIRARRRFAAAI
jgi:hypothetical protein